MDTRIVLVYIGRRWTGSKIVHYYLNENNDEDILIFDKKLLSVQVVGTRIETTETKTGVKSPYEYLGSTKEDISQWRVEDRAAGLAYDSHKRMKVLQSNDYDTIVHRIGSFYHNCSPGTREAFLFRLLSDIRNVKPNRTIDYPLRDPYK